MNITKLLKSIMEFFEHPNWRLTHRLLSFIGVWPFDGEASQFRSYLFFFLIVSILIPEAVKLIFIWGSVNSVAESVQIIVYHFGALLKLFNWIFNSRKLKSILETIRRDWQSDLSDSELQILKKYGSSVRIFSDFYAYYMGVATVFYLTTPLTPKILDIIIPLNESRPIQFLFPTEYFVDEQKYYVLIFIHAYIIGPFPSTINSAFDTAYIKQVQHACSMFAVVGHRIQHLSERMHILHKKMPNRVDKEINQLLKSCIKMHINAIRCCEALESAYFLMLLPLIIANVVALSITGFYTIVKINEAVHVIKFGSYTLGLVAHLFLFNYPGQSMIDHSDSIQTLVYDGNWYYLSPKIQVLFILTMVRSNKVCQLTAGKMCILSIESFSKNPNWRLTKLLLISFGAWPFQQPRMQKLLRSVVSLAILSLFIPEIFKVVAVRKNLNMIVECAPMLALHSLTITKLINCLFNIEKVKTLLQWIRHDWESDLSKTEIKILHENGQNTRRVTNAYIYFIYAVTLLYLTTPLTPKILDYFVPLNESRSNVLLYPTEYFVNPITYQVPILLHAYMISPFPSTVIVAFDSTYFTCVQHACSMFTIIGNRVQMLSNKANEEIQDDIANRKVHYLLRSCIKKHIATLQYCQVLESTYTTCLLVIVMINTLALSITGFYTVIKIHETSEALRFGIYTIGQIVHLYFLSYPGQNLMDYSQSVQELIYGSKWYGLPRKTRELFIFIMMRSRKPCKLTAGKMYTMSYVSFSKVIKTSISYFTLLTSLQ